MQRFLRRSEWGRLHAQQQLLIFFMVQLPRRVYSQLWTPSYICWHEKSWVTVISATHSCPAGKNSRSLDHPKRQYLCPTPANTMLIFSFNIQLGRFTANAKCICGQGQGKVFAGGMRALENISGLSSFLTQVAGWLITHQRCCCNRHHS